MDRLLLIPFLFPHALPGVVIKSSGRLYSILAPSMIISIGP